MKAADESIEGKNSVLRATTWGKNQCPAGFPPFGLPNSHYRRITMSRWRSGRIAIWIWGTDFNWAHSSIALWIPLFLFFRRWVISLAPSETKDLRPRPSLKWGIVNWNLIRFLIKKLVPLPKILNQSLGKKPKMVKEPNCELKRNRIWHSSSSKHSCPFRRIILQ